MSRKPNTTPGGKAGARPPRYSRTSAEWPCIFNTDLARDRLDPAIKKLWESRRSDRPKWGDLRTSFRRFHCRNVNPWGSDTCPFKEYECAMAFYRAVEQSLYARNPYGYFISVCRSTGAERADMGVAMRAQAARMRTDEPDEGTVGRPAPEGVREGPEDGLRDGPSTRLDELFPRRVDGDEHPWGVRGVATRPIPLGDVFREFGVRPRPRERGDSPPDEGEGR